MTNLKGVGEVWHEKLLLEAMENEGFNEKYCEAYKWLSSYYGNIQFPALRTICTALADHLSIPIAREFYRRKKTCYYWLHTNFETIKCNLKGTTKIDVYDGTSIIIPAFPSLEL